jgi:IS30 family transposase
MKHITEVQRYEISSYLKAGWNQQKIAAEIGVSQAAISKELSRNKTLRGVYNPKIAQENANIRKERFAKNRKFTPQMEKMISEKIRQQQWSPEQIVGDAKLCGKPMVCVERIYQFIRKNKKNGGDLWKHCRHKLKHRKRPISAGVSFINNRISIDKRPEIVDKRERFGDWELDLIEGKNHKNFILTMVERKTRFLMMKKLEYGKNADEVAKTVCNLLLPFKNVTHTITTDNGMEFAKHQTISKRLNAIVYFTNPYSSWQKGSIENTNKLIRQYLPKGTDFETITEQELKNYQYKINLRPRKLLNFISPLFLLNTIL